MEFTTLQLEQQPAVWRVRLNRPQLANAMSLTMVEELLALMNSAQQADCRVLVIEGNGDHFCAGGDIKDMQAAGGDSARLAEFNRAFGHMIETANRLPAVVVCALKGAVMGGGFGLACVSDQAIASSTARFALPETSLGILPAQIAPFVVQRIGLTQARRLALFGNRINAEEALRLGIVHQLCADNDSLESEVNNAIQQALKCAPAATAKTKALLHSVADAEQPLAQLLDQAAQDFAAAVMGEGREGAMAFMQKRPAAWTQAAVQEEKA